MQKYPLSHRAAAIATGGQHRNTNFHGVATDSLLETQSQVARKSEPHTTAGHHDTAKDVAKDISKMSPKLPCPPKPPP